MLFIRTFQYKKEVAVYRNSLYLDTLARVYARQTNLRLDSPDDYRKAINQFLDKHARATFSTKIQYVVLKALGLYKIAKRFIIKEMITGKRRQMYLVKEAEILQQRVFAYLPDTLEELLKSESGEIAGVLRSFEVKVRAKDPLAQTALMNEVFQQWILEVDLSKPEEESWYAKVAAILIVQTLVPGMEEHDPKILTPEFLDSLEKWGLLTASRPWLFIHGSHWSAERLGKAYQEDCWGWKSEPKRTDISTVSYQTRVLDWKEGRDQYEKFREVLARRMAEFFQSFELGEGKKVNETNLIAFTRSGDFLRLVDEIIANHFTQEMFSFKPRSRDLFPFGTSNEVNGAVISQTLNTLKTLLGFASANPEERIDILTECAESFYQLVTGLYVLEEAK